MTMLLPSPPLVASTSTRRAPDRRQAWASALCDLFLEMDVAILGEPTPYHLTSRSLGNMRVSVLDLPPHAAVRRADHVADDRRALIVIMFVLAGEFRLRFGGTSTTVRPGEFSVFDWEAPFSLAAPDGYRAVALQLPREAMLAPIESFGRRVSTGIRPTGALGQLAPGFFVRLADHTDRLHDWSGERIARTAADLAASVFMAHTRAAGTRRIPSADFLRACDFAEAHLADPQLNAHRIAAALFVSVRQLHKIFEVEGTSVSRWIRDRRLEECRAMLTNPAYAHIRVGEIGTSWGFFNQAHFSRVYRAKYGCSPREHRQGVAA